MNETDAVSCLLCLQPDEYGSMISVCVPAGRIPPSPERVICRRCFAALADAARESQGEEIGQSGIYTLAQSGDALDRVASGGAGDPEWDRALPERSRESVVEVDRSEPEDAAGSSRGAEAGRVTEPGTDE